MSDVIWASAGQMGYYLVSFVTNVILARIIIPNEFGKFGIVFFIISVARVLSESGLGGAIIRNNKAKEVDYSTIFIFNLIISFLLMLLLIFIADYVALFYDDSELKNVIIFSSFALIINAFHFIQITNVIKKMRFKAKALYDFGAIVISSIIAIILAKLGYGIWSLVSMQLFTVFISGLLMWIFEDRIKYLVFSYDSFLFHFNFGINTTIASVLSNVFNNLNIVLIGKYFNLVQSGFYYQAYRLQDAPIGIINYLNQNVIYSSLAKLQDDKPQFARTYRAIVRFLSVVTIYICMILYVFSDGIVETIYGVNWKGSGYYLRVLSLAGFFFIQEMFIRNLFKIFNQTFYVLKLELIKKVVHMLTLVVSITLLRIDLLLYGYLFTNILSFLFNYIVSRRVYPFLGLNDISTILKLVVIFFLIDSAIRFIDFYLYNQFNLILGFIIASILYLLALIILQVVKRNDLRNLLAQEKK